MPLSEYRRPPANRMSFRNVHLSPHRVTVKVGSIPTFADWADPQSQDDCGSGEKARNDLFVSQAQEIEF
jgi:hypothetical protein